MKLQVLIWCFSCFMLMQENAEAQNRSIRFEEGSFADALKLADEQGKCLFMDCYTSWCGPCKLLAKNVFTQDSVADFFNTHFINFSMDMEQGEGPLYMKKYQIEVYPTLLLLNARGEEMYRSVGGCTAAELISRFREAMNPENTLPVMTKKFAEGARNTDFVSRYFQLLKKGQRLEELEKVTVAYFREMSIRQISREPYWNLYHEYVSIDNPVYRLLVDSVKTWKALKGRELIEEKLAKEYDAAIMGRIPNVGHTEAQVKRYEEEVEKIGFQDTVQLFYLRSYLKIARLKAEKKYDEYLDFMENQVIPVFSPAERGRAIVSLLLLSDGSKEQRQRGMELLMNEAKKIVQSKGKLSSYEDQMFGFIQYKLTGNNQHE